MSDLIFYTNPMSRGRIVRWMLEELGCKYRTEVIEYGTAMKTEPFISINPMGKVPTISHLGKNITETPAILAYLADAFPEAGLAPALNERDAYYRWLFFAAGPLESALMNKSLGFEVPDDPKTQGMAGYGNYDLLVKVLAQSLTGVNYIAGEKFSAADVYLGSHIGWGMQFNTLPKLPEFEKYLAKLNDRDAYQRANDIDNALMPSAEEE
ncbi:MAG: glutathione S-transferase family protein [Gammaproteobacteria bacterium]|jgi:glutathione S-transferase|nr:glutathione S-transferase family protein [Gammaproteobacteria bacterium]